MSWDEREVQRLQHELADLHKHFKKAIDIAIAEEREACAKLVEDCQTSDESPGTMKWVADEIRARGGA